MEFAWNEERQTLRDAAVAFAEQNLRDGVIERDRRCIFSREAWQACAEFGVQGLLVAPEFGGAGQDLLATVAVLEGLGFGGLDNGLVFSVCAHNSSCEGPLSKFGTPDQKKVWMPGLVDGSLIGATAITEPDSGSDAFGLSMRADPDGDDFVLNGSKTFITNAPVADLFLVYARTGGERMFGITCFLVPRGTSGLTVGPEVEKSGLRTSPMAEVFFEDCRVPASSVVGSVGAGAMVFSEAIELERLLVLAPAVGAMERLLHRCVEHARQRKLSGVPIGKNQAVSHRIVDMELKLESSRLLLYRAAWHKMRHRDAQRETALAKVALSEAYVEVARSAMQVFGGYGYTVEYEIERELRDASAGTLYVGTSEILRNIVAQTHGM